MNWKRRNRIGSYSKKHYESKCKGELLHENYEREKPTPMAILWFKMSNDAFYELYGFNFNPHDYPYLYEIARDEVYGGK